LRIPSILQLSWVKEHRWQVFWLLFLVSMVFRLGIVFGFHLDQHPFRGELQKIAEDLAQNGEYGNPYRVPTGPSAHASPLYTLITAGVFRLLGIGTRGELGIYLVAILFTSLLWALLPWFGRVSGVGEKAGFLTGMVGAAVPFHFLNEIRAGDAPLAALLLMGILYAAIPWARGIAPSWKQSLTAGILWGLALLLLPSVLPFLIAVTVVSMVRVPSKKAFGRLGLTWGLAILCLLPWALRNEHAFGEMIWFRSNLGLELRLAFNDQALPDIDSNRESGSFQQFHPFVSRKAARKLERMGELEYNRMLLRETLDWIVEHPGRSARLVVLRCVYFWFPKTLKPVQTLILSLISVGGFLGLWVLIRRREAAALLFITLWLTFPLVYYLTQSAVRYRYPINWTLLLAAAVILTQFGDTHQSES